MKSPLLLDFLNKKSSQIFSRLLCVLLCSVVLHFICRTLRFPFAMFSSLLVHRFLLILLLWCFCKLSNFHLLSDFCWKIIPRLRIHNLFFHVFTPSLIFSRISSRVRGEKSLSDRCILFVCGFLHSHLWHTPKSLQLEVQGSKTSS